MSSMKTKTTNSSIQALKHLYILQTSSERRGDLKLIYHIALIYPRLLLAAKITGAGMALMLSETISYKTPLVLLHFFA